MTPEQRKDDRQRREDAIATLDQHPGWLALCELMQEECRYERLNMDHPNWSAKSAYKAGRIEKTLDILKAVRVAVERKTRPGVAVDVEQHA